MFGSDVSWRATDLKTVDKCSCSFYLIPMVVTSKVKWVLAGPNQLTNAILEKEVEDLLAFSIYCDTWAHFVNSSGCVSANVSSTN